MSHMVSVITPIYNSEKFIRDCVESVLGQTFENWEHLLIDDCSKDDSAKIIKKYGKSDKRIRYHKLSSNQGAGIARNTGIELAKGRYIAFLDSDDSWHPDKLERQLSFMKENDYHFTFTNYDIIDVDGQKQQKQVRCKSKVTYKSALYKNPIGCLTAMYNVDFFGKQYMPSIRKRQDYALWLKLLKKTNGYGLNECLASYRTGNESISANKFDLIKYEWKIYRDIEGLSLIKSSFYLLSAVVLKLKSYF